MKIFTQGLTKSEIDLLVEAFVEIKSYLPQINFTFHTTNIPLSSRPFKNDVAQGYLLNNTSLFQLVDGSDDIVCLFYDWKMVNPQTTNPSTDLIKKGNTIPMSIPKQWYNGYKDVLIQFFLHELSHAEHFRAGVKDLTHDFYSSNFVQVQGTGLRDYYLFLLRKLMPNTPVVTLTRKSDDGVQTLGELSMTGFNCKTLERPWKNNQPNISAIPKGTYKCKYTWSLKFLKYTYELQNVSGRTGVRIHSANFYSQLLGCIALGDSYSDINGDKKVDILNSRNTVLKFQNMLQNKDFILKIV